MLKKFPSKPILSSLYLESDEGRWLTGLRVFCVQSLIERPDYVLWLKESLAKLKKQ